MGLVDAIRGFIDPSLSKPPQESPFDQYRYPIFVVNVPSGQRAPQEYTLSPTTGWEREFKKNIPYATADEIANIQFAFDQGVPAVRILFSR